MSMHSIEPGQRLRMEAGERSGFVEVLSEAVVPADYWICRDESSGQRKLVARTALFPIAAEATVADATVSDAPAAHAPVVETSAVQHAPAVPAAQSALAAASETLPSAA
ncbi:MAG TPA: hypothetical protein VHC19_20740 [Pirellulales bacterium]|nr:hypothetical protein [Pirellulales bacterium]